MELKYTNTMSTSRELSNSKLQAIGKLRENHTAFLRFLKERAVVKATDARLKRDSILAASVAARNKVLQEQQEQQKQQEQQEQQHEQIKQQEFKLSQKQSESERVAFKQFMNETKQNILSPKTKVTKETKETVITPNDLIISALLENSIDRRRHPSSGKRRRSKCRELYYNHDTAPTLDHESLNLFLHDAALEEAHRRLEVLAASCRRKPSSNISSSSSSSSKPSTSKPSTSSSTTPPSANSEWFLRIDIDGAHGLRNADEGIGDISDPYAIVRLNGIQICKTSTIDNSLDPIWDYQKEIHVTLQDLAPLKDWHDCTIDVTVYDEDLDADADDFLGRVSYTGDALNVLFKTETKRKKYSLENENVNVFNAKGTITLKLELIEKITKKIPVKKKEYHGRKYHVDDSASDSDDLDESFESSEEEDDDVDTLKNNYQKQMGFKGVEAKKHPTTQRQSGGLVRKESRKNIDAHYEKRRSSSQMAKSRREASVMSLKDMMAKESGDVSLSWLMAVPMFADLTPPEINALRDSLIPESYQDGDVIIQEGDRNASKFYIIKTNNVDIYKTIDGEEKHVATMVPGQTFGERALMIAGEARAATCKAKGSVTCLVLDREVFNSMLSSSTTLIDAEYEPGRGNDPDAAGLTKHVKRFAELIRLFTTASALGNRDLILETGLCMELHKLFSPELKPKDVIERTISTMYSLFGCERVGLFLIDHEADKMILVVSATARYITLPLTGLAGSVAKTGLFEIIRDAYRDPRFDQSMDKETGYRTRTMLACPLKNPHTGEVIAVIQLINKKNSEPDDKPNRAYGKSSLISPTSDGSEHHIKTVANAMMAASYLNKKTRQPVKPVKRNSMLLNSLAIFQEEDKEKTKKGPSTSQRSGTSIKGLKGRGGRTIRGRTIAEARQRKRIELDNAPVDWPTFSPDDIKLLSKIAEQLEPVIRDAKSKNKADKCEKKFKNLQKLDYSLLVELDRCENLRKFVQTGPKDKETGQRTGPVHVIPVPKGKKIEVTLAVYHGEKMLRQSCTSNIGQINAEGNVLFNEKLIHDCRLNCLPRATRLIFIVHKPGKGPDGTNKPIGWGGMSAMDYKDALVSGKHCIRLWSGPCLSPTVPILQPVEDSKSAGFLYLTFPDFGQEVRFYEVDDEELGETVKEIGMSRREKKRAEVSRRASAKRFFVDLSGISAEKPLDPVLHNIIYHTALSALSKKEQQIVWNARDRLTKIPLSLPKVLLSVQWDQPHIVSEMHTLLYMWERMEPLQALQLLDSRFPDPKVRAYAVQLLDDLVDEELRSYLLQLVQCLKHEAYHDSALSRFLVCRAVQSPDQIGHILYWLLKSEVHIDVVRDRFSLILAEYLRAVEPEVRTELGHQGFVMRRLVAIATEVGECKGGKSERKKLLRERLRATALPATFQLPLSPDVICDGIRVEECRVMDSKKKPLWLVFDAIDWKALHKDSGAQVKHFKFPVLFKAGDDLRQDQLTLQLLSIMDQQWKKSGMDLQLSPYGCVATGDQIGFLEVVQHSTTLASVVKANTSLDRGKKGLMARFSAAKKAVYDDKYLKVWLEAEARESFSTGIVLNPLLLSDRQHSDVKAAKSRELDNQAASTATENQKQFDRRFMLS